MTIVRVFASFEGAWQAIIGQLPSPWPRLYLHMTSHVIVDVRWVAPITTISNWKDRKYLEVW